MRHDHDWINALLPEQNDQGQAPRSSADTYLRSLIDEVIVMPEEGRGRMTVALRGDLAAFLDLSELPGSGSVRMLGTLVAGTGFEPVTFRL